MRVHTSRIFDRTMMISISAKMAHAYYRSGWRRTSAQLVRLIFPVNSPLSDGRPRSGSMSPERLTILYVSQMPASPPRFGAQARVHGLMTQLARRHELTAVMLVDDEFDTEECRRAMQAYCRDVVLVRNPYGRDGLAKRLLQLRSLASTRSFERLRVTVPALQRALDQVLRATEGEAARHGSMLRPER